MDNDSNLRSGDSGPDGDLYEDTVISLRDLVEYLRTKHHDLICLDQIFLWMPDVLAIVGVTTTRFRTRLEVILSDQREENSDFSTWLRRRRHANKHPRNRPNKRPEAGSHRPRQGIHLCLGIGPLFACSYCFPGGVYHGPDPEMGK